MELKDFLPIPDLDACESLLCIQPHPDDNEVGAGATIARLAAKGCKITYLTVTNGNMGTIYPKDQPAEVAARRRRETLGAAAVLGVSECRFLDYDDVSYPDEKILCHDITSVIREIRPEMIMTVDPYLPYESHPDHISVGKAAAQAFLLSPFRLFHKESSVNFGVSDVKAIAFYGTAYPNTYMDADKTWELKIKAIETHKSQFGPSLSQEMRFYFEYKARGYGAAAGLGRAEAFKVLTGQHLHFNVDTLHL